MLARKLSYGRYAYSCEQDLEGYERSGKIKRIREEGRQFFVDHRTSGGYSHQGRGKDSKGQKLGLISALAKPFFDTSRLPGR